MAVIERALVIGAGIGGLATVTGLRRHGIDADIIERNPDATVYGVGINQPGNSLRALRAIGAYDDVAAAGFEYDRYVFCDHRSNEIVSVPSGLAGDGVPANIALSRKDLHSALLGTAERAGADVRYATTADRVTDTGEAVEVTFSDGREETYDLVVAADGIRSELRHQLFGDAVEPVYTGYGVWRITIPRPADMRDGMVFQGIDAKGGLIPLNEQEMYLFLVTPEPQDARYPKEDMPELLRQRLEGFEGLPGDIRDVLKPGDDVVYNLLYDVMLPLPWHQGRIVIVGDAAHACAPHLTQGAGMSIEDGMVLGEELDGDGTLEEALTAFGERRLPRAKFVHDVSRQILEAEMEVTSEEALAGTAEYWRENLTGQTNDIDAFLSQPA